VSATLVEEATARLAAKAERAKEAASSGPYADPKTVADIDRLPELAPELAAVEEQVRALRDERDAAILRLMSRAKVIGAKSALSQAVVGHLAGGSKSLTGRVLTDHADRVAAATAKRPRGV